MTAVPDDHESHTPTAEGDVGLSGRFARPIKVAVIGAGSVFTHKLVCDILQIAGAERGEIALVDIDAGRLGPMTRIVQKTLEAYSQQDGWAVTASTDRREILAGCDYLLCCIEVEGVHCAAHDYDIPAKYDIDQCIGDTIGPGGLFKALRTVPVYLDILRDARELCPRALMLNYTNPMAIMCLAAGRVVPDVASVGLCHSVQNTGRRLAEYAGVPFGEVRWRCAGVNHLAWFTRFEHDGRDLYEAVLYERFRRDVEAGRREAERGLAQHTYNDDCPTPADARHEQEDLVRKDMCLNFGAFITESSGHLSEYLPYYRKSKAGRDLLRLGFGGASRHRATHWPRARRKQDEKRQAMLQGAESVRRDRSAEYAPWIIEACEKDAPTRIHGNVMNSDPTSSSRLITNLPADGCVEVACLVDGSGLSPTRYGQLPAQMAGVCSRYMRMCDLAATACIEKSKEAAMHALLLDPLSAAVCTPRQIREMATEMFEIQTDYLPGYQ